MVLENDCFQIDEAIWPWRGKKWAHMMADSEEELYLFALKLDLKKEWIQHKIALHFDITASKKETALKMGAV